MPELVPARLGQTSARRGLRPWIGLLAALAFVAGCSDGGGEDNTAETKPVSTKAATQDTKRESKPATARLPQGSGFDFYVLSLSWSPSWCADNDPSGRTGQCDARADNGFVVHGLWPQYERGYPEFCDSGEPDRVSDAVGRTVLDIMPSMGLIGHQWRKHGRCSGLSQRDFFRVVSEARDRVVIPAELKQPKRDLRRAPLAVEDAFIAANPGLKRPMIAATCRSGALQEVRICLSRTDLGFRPCPEVDGDSCRARELSIPSVP